MTLFLLKMLRSFYMTLAGSGQPSHLAFGGSIGILAALIPLGLKEPVTYLLLYVLLCTRAGVGMFMLISASIKPVMIAGGYTLTYGLGVHLLERMDGLKPTWAGMLDQPVVALFRFDRYEVFGGAVAGLALGLVLFYPMLRGIVKFREKVVPKLKENRFVKWFQSFWFIKLLGLVIGGK